MPPRPKPNHLHVVEGTGRVGRHSLGSGPQPDELTEAPDPPDSLSPDARLFWIRTAPLLQSMRVLTTADLDALAEMSECHSEIQRLRMDVREFGHVYETETKAGGCMIRARPEVAMLADADRRFKGYLIEFGMTPAARTKVKVTNGAKKDSKAAGYFAS